MSATASLFGEFNLYVLYLKKFEGKVRADLAKWLIYKLNVAYNPKDDTDLGWGLVAYYPFNGNANDMSGNGNNGTVDGATLTADRHGKANSAYYFDGQSRIEVPNSNSLKSMMNDYSISLWTKSSENMLSPLCKSSYLDYPIHFRISIVDKMVEAIANGNNFQFTNLWQINQWNHIALIYSGDICRLFLNNNEVASPVVSQGKYPYSIDNILYIGQDPHGWMEHHIGEIDDIRIYNRALTSDELNALYNENSSGSGSGGGGGSSW